MDENITDGILVTKFEQNDITQGFNYGIGIESAFFDNFSVRAEYSYVSYSSFDTDLESHIIPANNQLILSVLYHFDI